LGPSEKNGVKNKSSIYPKPKKSDSFSFGDNRKRRASQKQDYTKSAINTIL